MSGLEDTINSFTWIERPDGTVIPIGNVDGHMAVLEVHPHIWVPGVVLDLDEDELGLEDGDMLRGVVNE